MELVKPFSLGPLPWSDDVLVRAVYEDFRKAEAFVKEHPGYDINERLDSLRAVLRIFNKAALGFASGLEQFFEQSRGGHLFRRNRRADLEAFEEQFRELLYVFSAAAMTLVDQSRTFSKNVPIDGYEGRVSGAFRSNPRHAFVQELRVDLIHVTLHQPGWQLTSGRNEQPTAKFMLWPSQLIRVGNYRALAKQFVRENPNGIDLGLLVSEYAGQVQEFHAWLHAQVEASVGDQVRDYQRCHRRIKAVSARFMWNLILKQVLIGGNRDPYKFLDQYLTADELADVESLPSRSAPQVDRIIALVDELGACDDELRATAYRAFGVAS